jgi:hypothetical protein
MFELVENVSQSAVIKVIGVGGGGGSAVMGGGGDTGGDDTDGIGMGGGNMSDDGMGKYE